MYGIRCISQLLLSLEGKPDTLQSLNNMYANAHASTLTSTPAHISPWSAISV